MNSKINIGELIRDKLQEDRRTVSWLAGRMGCSRANMYKILNNDHLHVVQIRRISSILGHNFFTPYFEEVESDLTMSQN